MGGFCATVHDLSTEGSIIYTVGNVGGGIGQDPATEVTHSGHLIACLSHTIKFKGCFLT